MGKRVTSLSRLVVVAGRGAGVAQAGDSVFAAPQPFPPSRWGALRISEYDAPPAGAPIRPAGRSSIGKGGADEDGHQRLRCGEGAGKHLAALSRSPPVSACARPARHSRQACSLPLTHLLKLPLPCPPLPAQLAGGGPGVAGGGPRDRGGDGQDAGGHGGVADRGGGGQGAAGAAGGAPTGGVRPAPSSSSLAAVLPSALLPCCPPPPSPLLLPPPALRQRMPAGRCCSSATAH